MTSKLSRAGQAATGQRVCKPRRIESAALATSASMMSSCAALSPSTGAGGITHVVTEAWRCAVGVETEPVHFRGTAAAIPDVLANRVPIFMDGIQLLGDHANSGRLRGIFVTRADRQPLQPNVPTTREIGIPQVNFESWFAMYAPRGTPREIVQRLAEINRPVMLNPAVRDRLAVGAVDAVPSTPEELQAITERDFRMFGEVVRAANIRAE